MSWKDSIRDLESTSEAPSKSWRDTISTDVGEGESLVRGAAQGVSLGYSDEITGLLESMLSSKTYEQSRDESRSNNREAQETNPLSYGAGEVGGAVATAFVPGLNVAKGATLASRAGLAALQGGIAGAGLSEADLTKGDVSGLQKDTAIGAALGGGLQVGGEALLKGIPKAFKAGKAILQSKADDKMQDLIRTEVKAGKILPSGFGVDDVSKQLPSSLSEEEIKKTAEKSTFKEWSLKKLGRTAFDVPEDATEAYLKNKDVITKARSFEDTADYALNDIIPQFKQHIAKLDSKAWETLSVEPTINKIDVMTVADDFIQGVLKGPKGTLTRTAPVGADADIISRVAGELDNIRNAYGDKLSQQDLKSIVQSLQKLGYSLEGSPKSTLQGKAIRELGGAYNEVLKNMNESYKTAMIPVARQTGDLQKFEKYFVNQQAPDSIEKFVQTSKKLHKMTDRSDQLKGLRGIDEVTGGYLEQDVRDRLLLNAFSGGNPNGSRRTMFGGAVSTAIGTAAGTLVGGPVGAIIGGATGLGSGALFGFGVDKYSGAVFKKLLDGTINAADGSSQLTSKLGKYAAPLAQAASRGNSALQATHFLLSQRDPEYQKMIEQQKQQEQ